MHEQVNRLIEVGLSIVRAEIRVPLVQGMVFMTEVLLLPVVAVVILTAVQHRIIPEAEATIRKPILLHPEAVQQQEVLRTLLLREVHLVLRIVGVHLLHEVPVRLVEDQPVAGAVAAVVDRHKNDKCVMTTLSL